MAERREGAGIYALHPQHPADTPLELTLRKGRNSVLVFFDDLAEAGRGVPAAFVLAGNGCAAGAARARWARRTPSCWSRASRPCAAFASAATIMRRAPSVCGVKIPFAQQTLHVTLEGATEENEQAGVLFTRTADFAPRQTRASPGTAPSSRSDFFCCRPPLWWRE